MVPLPYDIDHITFCGNDMLKDEREPEKSTKEKGDIVLLSK